MVGIAFIITTILFTQFISSSVISWISIYSSYQFVFISIPFLEAHCRRVSSSLLYNINLYYNQSNSLRIKRDLLPALQNKWTHVNTMHQYNILFAAQRKYNIIIYVVLLALKAYRPFSRIAKSNLPKSLTHKYCLSHTHPLSSFLSASQFLLYHHHL